MMIVSLQVNRVILVQYIGLERYEIPIENGESDNNIGTVILNLRFTVCSHATVTGRYTRQSYSHTSSIHHKDKKLLLLLK